MAIPALRRVTHPPNQPRVEHDLSRGVFDSQTRTWSRHSWLLFVSFSLAETLVLAWLAARFSINADEGFYLRAGHEVLLGRRLYADFFFPQMPYLPFAEAAVMAVTGPSLFAGRAISVVTGGLLAGLLAAAAVRMTGQVRAGIVVGLAYIGHTVLISSLTITKTYGVANLALVGAVLLVGASPRSIACAVAAGLCAGLAVGTRLPSAAAAGVLLLWSAWHGRRQALAFATGVLVASLPWLWVAAQDPQAFWFGNVMFHELRREITGLGPILKQKGVVLAKWILWPQDLVLWALAAIGALHYRRQTLLVAACTLVLAGVYLAATPTYLEYMTQLVPLLLLASIPALPMLFRRRALALVSAVLYMAGMVIALRVNLDSNPAGQKVGVGKVWLWHQGVVLPVARYLRDHSKPGDRILSWWEGYPFLAEREGFNGVGFWESNVAEKLPSQARHRYHLLGREDIERLVAAGEPRLVAFPNGVWDWLGGALAKHYRLSAHLWTIEIFELRDGRGQRSP
jgi:hypothetical protein